MISAQLATRTLVTDRMPSLNRCSPTAPHLSLCRPALQVDLGDATILPLNWGKGKPRNVATLWRQNMTAENNPLRTCVTPSVLRAASVCSCAHQDGLHMSKPSRQAAQQQLSHDVHVCEHARQSNNTAPPFGTRCRR